jgi:O-methyltransferase
LSKVGTLLSGAGRAVKRPRRTLVETLMKLTGEHWIASVALERLTRVEEEESIATLALERLALGRLYDDEVGREYGVGREQKEELVSKIQTITREIPAGTTWVYHVILASHILQIPASAQGIVIECGCWKGASSASLSLVCGMTGRRLLVCDSFEGLPEEDADAAHEYTHLSTFGYYQKGMYAGRLEEVQSNVARFGDISACSFVKGFFSESLKSLDEPVALAFLDVDLVSSMKDCIKQVWPLLIPDGYVFTDDSCDMDVVRVWFDEAWWRGEMGERSPGYVGSGCGLPVHPRFSSLGYTRKVRSPEQSYGRVPWLYYPDAPSRGVQFPDEARG